MRSELFLAIVVLVGFCLAQSNTANLHYNCGATCTVDNCQNLVGIDGCTATPSLNVKSIKVRCSASSYQHIATIRRMTAALLVQLSRGMRDARSVIRAGV